MTLKDPIQTGELIGEMAATAVFDCDKEDTEFFWEAYNKSFKETIEELTESHKKSPPG